jgi:hypothetical protein
MKHKKTYMKQRMIAMWRKHIKFEGDRRNMKGTAEAFPNRAILLS